MNLNHFLYKRHLEEGETIKYAVHKHWTSFLGLFFRGFFFGILIPAILLLLGFNTPIVLLVLVIWIGLGFFRIIYDWVDWYSDVWIFTDMSVIVVEWNGFFSNLSTRIDYGDIEGVAFQIDGFFATVFRYGTVILKVISGNNIEKKNVRCPKKVELALMKYQGEYMKDKEMKDADALKRMLSSMIAHHNRMR
jgi:hypothetical protein